jgi:hypothetical protein
MVCFYQNDLNDKTKFHKPKQDHSNKERLVRKQKDNKFDDNISIKSHESDNDSLLSYQSESSTSSQESFESQRSPGSVLSQRSPGSVSSQRSSSESVSSEDSSESILSERSSRSVLDPPNNIHKQQRINEKETSMISLICI